MRPLQVIIRHLTGLISPLKPLKALTVLIRPLKVPIRPLRVLIEGPGEEFDQAIHVGYVITVFIAVVYAGFPIHVHIVEMSFASCVLFPA